MDDDLWHAIEDRERKIEQDEIRKFDSILERQNRNRARMIVLLLVCIAVLIALHFILT